MFFGMRSRSNTKLQTADIDIDMETITSTINRMLSKLNQMTDVATCQTLVTLIISRAFAPLFLRRAMSTPPCYQLPDLLALMQQLRDHNAVVYGIAVQTFASIVPYTLEEAYEVADSIEREDWQALKANWGICCSRWCSIARWRRKGWFGFDDVVDSVKRETGASSSACSGAAQFADTGQR